MRPYRQARMLRRYFRELDRIAPRQAGACTAIDAAGLPVLTVETVEDREVRFSLVIGQPRLRLTFPDFDPTLLGHVWGLADPDARFSIS